MDEITNFKCQSASFLALNERVCCLDPDFVFVFLHIMEPLCGVMCSYYVERDSFRVSLGRRCWLGGQLPRDQLGELDNTDLAWCHSHCLLLSGLGLIDQNFMITKSMISSRAGSWIMFQGAPLVPDPGSRGSQPSRRGLKRSRAVIGQEMGGELRLVETNRWMFPLASRA